MVKMRKIFIAALAATAGIILFFWFFTGDEAKIKKQFKILEELASKDSVEHELIAAANARKIGNMFTGTCRIEIPSHSISRVYKRENIPAYVMAARSQYSAISLKFYDILIRFPEEHLARISFTAHVDFLFHSGETIREVQELDCSMEKIEKEWYFSRIETITVLER